MNKHSNNILKFLTVVITSLIITLIIDTKFIHKAEAATNPAAVTNVANNTKTPAWYSKSIPLTYNEQKYLYDLCVMRGLDYKEMLAVIKHESSFNKKAMSGSNYGYFQINKVNHATLAKKLKTKVAPYDPYVNMNWGTYMMADLTNKYKKKGLKGNALRDAVLSAYNKGEGGYARTGKAVSYIKKHNECLAYVRARV
ncbi:transglycosylase SLT domain-containing protein [Bacillus massiliigorillae]|uniref:transglycosylase SLT domain-containing protein n=1 Tax=Bacillus massiliigorillae TaxID=1243664 RepID=UPI0003A233C2|nr:transglycosylase SLT domain-containing protein [Bacillus massiliigorillae]